MFVYDVLHKETVYHAVVNDLRSYGVKYRFKKSMFKTDRLEDVKYISKKVFKTSLLYQPLDVVHLSSGAIVHVPVFISQASAFLEKSITQEGLFRKAGSQLRQKELIIGLDNGGSIGEKSHAVDVANCLKTFFRELPEPLIPYSYHDLFVHCVMLKTNNVQALLLACILLPPYNLNTLAFFMEFLKKVSLYEKQNKMNIENLAKVIVPNIMPLKEITMNAMQIRLELHLAVIKILIENAEYIGILPDNIIQAVSMETIGSTDNELDLSEQIRVKLKKKKYRSGSLTRKPHLSASNLNLRMLNGLKRIVGKFPAPEDNTSNNNAHISENCDLVYTSSMKSTKKRKVDYLDPASAKKKKVTDKSKNIRASLERFAPKKSKIVDEDQQYAAQNESYTKRRWSSVCDTYDSQRALQTYNVGSSKLKIEILKNGEMSNELHREYNNMFLDADVNLSYDSDEQSLLTKDNSGINKSYIQSSLDSEKSKSTKNCSQKCAYLQNSLHANNFKSYSHSHVASVDNPLEEYVTILKSEYEEIKNRVSAIETRISQEFYCGKSQSNESHEDSLSVCVEKVQTEYEKTLEEASIENTVTTDYLAKRLGKELKIRRSAEHKIIRSPSARKIGNLKRRSQEKISSKRVRRTASWHTSHGSNLQSCLQTNHGVNNVCSSSKKLYSISFLKQEDGNNMLNNVHNELSNINMQNKECDHNAVQPTTKSRPCTTIRRVSSFHGNEYTNTFMYPNENVEELKKTNSQQNIVLNNTHVCKFIPQSTLCWKDADGYFKCTNETCSPIVQTGRASIAKLRMQNAGMVLAKAKLFDECTTKVYSQRNAFDKCEAVTGSNGNQCVNNLQPNDQQVGLCQKVQKNIKDKNINTMSKHTFLHALSHTENKPLSINQGKTDMYYNIAKDTTITNVSVHQRENVTATNLPLLKEMPVNRMLQDARLSMYKADSNTLCRTPPIKKPLSVKTPKSGKMLTRKSTVESRRTPLKVVSHSGGKYQNPKNVLKSKNLNKCS